MHLTNGIYNKCIQQWRYKLEGAGIMQIHKIHHKCENLLVCIGLMSLMSCEWWAYMLIRPRHGAVTERSQNTSKLKRQLNFSRMEINKLINSNVWNIVTTIDRNNNSGRPNNEINHVQIIIGLYITIYMLPIGVLYPLQNKTRWDK